MHPEFTDSGALIFSLFYCPFMLALSVILLKFPPKKINSLYGYRTPRSMKNQDTWDTSNTYWTKLFVKLNLVSFIVPVITYFVYPSLNVLVTIIASTLLLLAIIPFTEMHLKKRFDNNGNRV